MSKKQKKVRQMGNVVPIGAKKKELSPISVMYRKGETKYIGCFITPKNKNNLMLFFRSLPALAQYIHFTANPKDIHVEWLKKVENW